jgi:glycosyltransferase involved in cell wall biosynthesis
MRILYLEQNVDGTTGGSYRSLLYLLKGLDRQAFTPIVGFYREHDLIEEYRSAGLQTLLLSHPEPVNLLPLVDRFGPLRNVLAPFVRLAQKLINLVKVSGRQLIRGITLLIKERVDVLHLNNGVTVGTELLIASRIVGIRSVIHQRGITTVPRWCAWLARRADHVICVSDAARDNLIAHGLRPDRCTAIHNGIDPEDLRRKIRRTPLQVRESLGLSDDTIVIGLAGMIRPWKGQMVLVKAMEQIHRRCATARALIIGGVADNYPEDRAYLNDMRQFIVDHDLGACVSILDYQPNAPEFLQIFDVMVHTAIDPEPFSRVVIEGMALGRPIVASATGGTPEAIEHGVSGLLVPADDADALAREIVGLIADPTLRTTLGSGAREKVARRFLIQDHVARTEAIYGRLGRP